MEIKTIASSVVTLLQLKYTSKRVSRFLWKSRKIFLVAEMGNQSERRISCLGFPWNRSNNFPSYVYSIKSFSLHMSKDYNAKCMELLLFWEEMMEKSVADTYTIRIFVHIVSRSLWGQVGVRNCIDLYV